MRFRSKKSSEVGDLTELCHKYITQSTVTLFKCGMTMVKSISNDVQCLYNMMEHP